jgi:hypothetical protein
MNEYVSVTTSDGGAIAFELAEDGSGPAPTGRRWLPETDLATLETGVDRATDAIRAVLARVRAMPEAPEKVVVEVGLKVTAEATIAIAKSSGEAHVKIAMEWTGNTPDQQS